MSTFYYTHVRRSARGVRWSDGEPQYCTCCGTTGRRRRPAIVTALLRRRGSKFKVPVGWCESHEPAEMSS